jgi:hypothetical protein
MKRNSFRAAVALTAAFTTAASPLLVRAQTTYEYRALKPGLVVGGSGTEQASPPAVALKVPELGGFSIASLVVGQSISLIPPTSTSPGAWSFTSSDMAVAQVTGSTLKAVAAGQVTITATQAADNGFTSASASTEISVASPYMFTVKGAPRLGNAYPGWGVPYDASLATTGQVIWPNSGSWLGARFVAQSTQTTFKFAADNVLTLYLDGTQVLHSPDWTKWGTTTVNTVPGRTYTLSVFVQDFGGYYGFTGNVTRTDTGSIILRTDRASWFSS